jgi:peptide/nickel transport system permease protein
MAVSRAVREGAARRTLRFRPRARHLPPTMLVGGSVLFLFLVVGVTAPLWEPYDPTQAGEAVPYLSPSWDHLFGTDVLGRDVFSRVAEGTREVLFLSLASTALAVVLGGIVGLVSGYVGGWADELLMRIFETIISIPLLVLALLAMAAAGPELSGSSALLIGVVVLVYAPRIARMARTVAVDLVTRDFVTVARSRGESAWSITRRELAPNATGVLLVEFGVRAGYAPILISSLGFLGFGARPPSSQWGLMISENRDAIVTAPVTVLAPSVALALLVISLNLFTDGLARYLGRTAVRTP